MDTTPFVTINPHSPTSSGCHQLSPMPSPIESGFTPMVLCTDSNGMQHLTPLPFFAPPFMMMPQMVAIDPNDASLPVPPLALSHSPASSPLPLPVPHLTLSHSPASAPLPMPPLTLSHSPSAPLPMPPIDLTPQIFRIPTDPVCEPSSSSENEEVFPDSWELPESDHQSKEAVKNDKNIAVPEFTAEMTKKDLVNLSLDWLYEVFGNNFDCDGRRGRNVLRIKVKTRGALEYICVLVQKCIDEGIIHHVSCPISTKKQKKHIRGYLAYLEAVSDEATARMIEIFNELNTAFVENCDGEMEHPFKGISRNPIPIRHNQVAA